MVDEAVPSGVGSYVKSEFLRPLDAGDVTRLLERWANVTSPMSQVLLRLLGGAIERVPGDETAFAHRDGTWMFTAAGMWPNPKADARATTPTAGARPR